MAGRPREVNYRQDFGGVSKVPAVKPYFWILKLLTTAMGEAVSDALVEKFNPYLAVFFGFAVFVIAIIWQFRTPGYRTWPYWTAVAMVAVFGTMAADSMHIALHVPYKWSATFFAVCLLVVFAAWYRTERTLDIHSIVTRRREVFYWATIILTFAMGTALGDLTATTLGLGYLSSAFLFIGLIVVPFAAWRLGVNPVLTFWVAYILTRPIGASFADFFGMPKTSSGLGIGHPTVAVVTALIVLASFAYVARSGIDRPSAQAAPALAPVGGYGPGGADGAAGYGPGAYEPVRRPEPGYYPKQQGYPQQPGYPPQQPGYPPQGYPQQGYPRQPGYGGPRYEEQWGAGPRYADPPYGGSGYGRPEEPGRPGGNQPLGPRHDQS